jgi:hypothetical protein
MRKPIKIGKKQYASKKEALSYYKAIFNSYSFGQSLNDNNYNDLIDLLDFDYINYVADLGDSDCLPDEDTTNPLGPSIESKTNDEDEHSIIDIKVSRVQFNTKCFEVFFSNRSSEYISYLMIINNKKYTQSDLFNIACRNVIQDDLFAVKQKYFDNNSVKGHVKCQETNQLSKWIDLVVDHRQPHTLSMIIDRFKEKNNIDIDSIEYDSNDKNLLVFKEVTLHSAFRNYHKEKASLRIVRKECNSSRTHMAYVKRSTKDLTIE